MIGDLIGGQEPAQEVLDRPQAQSPGEGDGRQFLHLVLVEEEVVTGRRSRCGDRRGPRSLLGRGPGRRLVGQPLFECPGVLVYGRATASGRLGLAGDGAVPTGEDRGGVEEPGADGKLEHGESLRVGGKSGPTVIAPRRGPAFYRSVNSLAADLGRFQTIPRDVAKAFTDLQLAR